MNMQQDSLQWVLSTFALSSVSSCLVDPYTAPNCNCDFARAASSFSAADSQIYMAESSSSSQAVRGWVFLHSDVALRKVQVNYSFSEVSKVSAVQRP